MNTWQDWLWRLLLGLVIILFAGQFLSTAVTFLSLGSPTIANLTFCPVGSVAKINPDPLNQREGGFGITCYDRSGSALVVFPNASAWTLERGYFFRPSYIIVTILVSGWYLSPVIRQTIKTKSKSS